MMIAIAIETRQQLILYDKMFYACVFVGFIT